MLKIEQLKNIYPLVVTPSHDGKYFYNYILSLLNFHQAALQIGMPIQFYLMQGESLVTRARNNCVATFLENKQWTHLFWIDADIGFSPDAAFRLLQADYDIAAGVYPLKRDLWPVEGLPKHMTQNEFITHYQQYTVNASTNQQGEVHIQIQEDGFIEINEAPTGFMLIKRQVFEKMMLAYPELNYVSDSIDYENKGLHFRFFDTMVHPESKRYLSEDYHFCYLWQQLGGKIYVDAKSNLSHQGTKLYQGNFAESLIHNLSNAIHAKEGAPMILSGLEHLYL
ncbi:MULTISPECIES: hypothetical protein [unclassified Acinetobacter]|uniref:hypothetical protein n=1 Tax=unclassified Acinetobacter TaxID=196816 RepID=UPI002934D16F|nr:MULTISPECIES: hypothetical protein [unclassified Acinetobacter]WOE30371.1 hypothetical protein QSG84_08045 [Acinetobacter sp. SAAs470]WOE38562.1 hypothetical protein QSG86_01710 [Acinetobacter sp. SAAs474]